ncbi:MAG TPA: GreA/GreB family elongation factor [Dehalococcoidia bacterium]|nr:GreA/GreB family elongation factor [Dehalococcoidia bacterium]
MRWYGTERRLSELNSHEVSKYPESLGVTLADASRKLEPVRSFLTFAKKKGFTATNMAVQIRPPKPAKAIKAPRRLVQRARESLTREGIAALEAELEELRSRRPVLTAELQRAMSDKDFRENAPLDALRDQQGHLESRIRDIETVVHNAVVVDKAGVAKSEVEMGSTVHLRNLKSGASLKYTVVSRREVNAAEGKISIDSPMGRSLVARREGEEVEVSAPAGSLRFRIEKIEA